MISFDDARRIAAHDPQVLAEFGEGVTIAEYGWQNGDEYLVAPRPLDEGALMDASDVLVAKASGEVRLVGGMLGKMPALGLEPIGDVPD